ncbi:MAG: hypothetical protein E3J64_02095, partial [Anaerolineales bacterium]
MQPWGPTALAVAPDGTFYIADGAHRRVLRYDAAGSFLSSIDLDEAILGVTDIEFDGDSLLVLDRWAVNPAVHRLDPQGESIERYGISEGLRVEILGIYAGPEGEVLAVTASSGPVRLSSEEVTQLTDDEAGAGLPGAGGRVYTLVQHGWGEDSHTGEIVLHTQSGDELRVVIEVEDALVGLRLLGEDPRGGFAILVEELLEGGTVRVDQTVRRYDRAGALLGMARVPLEEFYVPVDNGVCLGPDAQVYALVPKEDGVEIQRLGLLRRLEPLSPGPDEARLLSAGAESGIGGMAAASGCRSRTSMLATAGAYWGNLTYLSYDNIWGSCAYRQKPSYMSSPGYYGSVPYDAGGWDTRAA